MLFESVQDYAIFSMTTENIVDSWNSGAERLLGYSDQEIIGQSGAIIFTPEDRCRGVVETEGFDAGFEKRRSKPWIQSPLSHNRLHQTEQRATAPIDR